MEKITTFNKIDYAWSSADSCSDYEYIKKFQPNNLFKSCTANLHAVVYYWVVTHAPTNIRGIFKKIIYLIYLKAFNISIYLYPNFQIE